MKTLSHYMVWLGKHDYMGFVNFETFQGGTFWIEPCISIVYIHLTSALSFVDDVLDIKMADPRKVE